jgi:hypothetical protein
VSTSERLEAAYKQLLHYDSWEGQFKKSGCADPDQTLMLYWLTGKIITLQQFLDGAPMHELISVALDEVEEMTGVPVPEEEE